MIVSRGELVEIGGSFRVPEILERAGVRLVEVGSTNRTHLRDYADAIGPSTALLLKVHRSNFALHGFVAEVGLGELAALGARHGLPVLEDLGSGTFARLPGLPAEAHVPDRLRLGADLVIYDATYTDDEHNATLRNFYSVFGDVQTLDEVIASLKRGRGEAAA